MILIITMDDDVHALAIKRELDRRSVDCAILEVDDVAHRRTLSFELDNESKFATIWPTKGPDCISLADVGVIWLRRPRADQRKLTLTGKNRATEIALINNECRGAVSGVLASAFNGAWVSTPHATQRACDKLFQLRVARDCGFAIPPTLVSQDAQEVRQFYRQHHSRIIVKSIVGVESAFLLTRAMPDPATIEAASFTSCPAFYQANVPGRHHIRLVCFGDTSLAAVLESDDLDWRPNLNIPIREWHVPDAVHKRVRRVLDALDLEMGVIDIKQTPEGDLIWLEVNPQGQFLFLEAITNLRLAERFADYLSKVDGARVGSRQLSPGNELATGAFA